MHSVVVKNVTLIFNEFIRMRWFVAYLWSICLTRLWVDIRPV
jgi:hypothetical protein